MKFRAIIAAIALAAPSHAAWAQSGEQVSKGISAFVGTLSDVIAQSRLQRDISSMGAPLEYQSANIPLDPANPEDPRNFDVAGLRIGMKPEEVERTILRNGYKITSKGDQLSFDTEVRLAVRSGGREPQRNLVTGLLLASAPHNQELHVEFIVLPEGPRLSTVRFVMGSDDMTKDAFLAQVLKKYGDTAMDNSGDTMLWCAAPDRCDGDWNHHAYMRVDISSKVIQLTNVDAGLLEALEARKQAEIDKRKPQVQEARF